MGVLESQFLGGFYLLDPSEGLGGSECFGSGRGGGRRREVLQAATGTLGNTAVDDNKILHDLIWRLVKIMVPFWVLNIMRHLVFRVPKRGP